MRGGGSRSIVALLEAEAGDRSERSGGAIGDVGEIVASRLAGSRSASGRSIAGESESMRGCRRCTRRASVRQSSRRPRAPAEAEQSGVRGLPPRTSGRPEYTLNTSISALQRSKRAIEGLLSIIIGLAFVSSTESPVRSRASELPHPLARPLEGSVAVISLARYCSRPQA